MNRGLARTAACVLLCVVLALAGSIVALRAASPESRAVTLGTVDVRVAPARSGEVDVYVPVVDWGVRAEPYTAPVAVELEFRSLDRTAAGGAQMRASRGWRETCATRSRTDSAGPQCSRSSAASSEGCSGARSSPGSPAAAGSCSGRAPASR